MKKTILLLSLSGLSCSALAHDGTVNITGTIQGNTCTVTTDTANQQVTLGDIAAKQFTAAGSASQPIAFTIGLENCGSAASAVSLTFTGGYDQQRPAGVNQPGGQRRGRRGGDLRQPAYAGAAEQRQQAIYARPAANQPEPHLLR